MVLSKEDKALIKSSHALKVMPKPVDNRIWR